MLTGYASIRHVEVSLPFVRRSWTVRNTTWSAGAWKAPSCGGARAPLLRFLARLALKCDNAEELGRRLRRRYQRQQQRQDLVRPGRAEADAEIERLIAD